MGRNKEQNSYSGLKFKA